MVLHPYTVAWNDGTSNIATTSTTSVSPASTTTYTLTITNTSTGCTKSATPQVITVNPAPTAPTATNSSQCGTGVATGAVADPNAFTTPTFKWYAASTGGTAVQSSTATTYTTSISSTQTFYVSVTNPTTGCESARTAITLNVNPPDAIAASSSASTICLGTSVNLIATTTGNSNGNIYSFTWSAPAGSGITGSTSGGTGTFGTPTSTSVTPTVAGTYVFTLNGIDGACNAVASTVTVTVTGLPTVTITPTTAVVCSGSPITLTAQANNIASGTVTIGTGTDVSTLSTDGTPYRTGNTVGNQFKKPVLNISKRINRCWFSTW